MTDTKRLRELLAVATFYQYKEDLNERVRRERATEDVLRLAPALLDEVERLRGERPQSNEERAEKLGFTLADVKDRGHAP